MKYVNPGYGELFPMNSYFAYATLEDWIKNPNCGVMTYFVKGTSTFSYAPALGTFNGEVYGKYITYCADNYGAFNIHFSDAFSYVNVKYSSAFVNYGSSSNKTIPHNNGLHSVDFHYKVADGANTGLLELIVDGVSVFSVSHSKSTSDSTVRLTCTQRTGSNYCMGNLILSDEYISPKEEVIILPTSGVETDMTDNGDGTYTASEAGQTLLQTVDASDLITKYGRSSKLTSLAVAGVPAYNSSGALSLVGIDKIAGTVAEHDKISVGSSDSVGAIDLWTTNMTIGKLDGKQAGWKAAT